jgi:hypothetical protein
MEPDYHWSLHRFLCYNHLGFIRSEYSGYSYLQEAVNLIFLVRAFFSFSTSVSS